MRARYHVDQERILGAITKRVNDEGWSLYPQEIASIRKEIDALIKEIL